MTKDDPINPLKPPCDSISDQHEKPFQIVLVDIEKAAWTKKIICVEKPLEDKNLKFVALSYRWGEVHEQCVDTHVGYMASITSFFLEDFYELCELISREPELKSMDYVWVDAICVDQNNRARRKATVYQMSNIYERANYILAVPDLHLNYLMHANIGHRDIINNTFWHRDYIYNLIHGSDIEQLVQLDQEWLDSIHVPKDPTLRNQKLSQFKHLFVDQLETLDNSNKNTLDHIWNTIQVGESSDNDDRFRWLLNEIQHDQWKRKISQRNQEINQCMDFLSGLIIEWSSRVWVMSEYHIAKNKPSRKLKFWFLSIKYVETSKLGFFDFDFDHGTVRSIKPRPPSNDMILITDAHAAYKSFEKTMAHQLVQQSFLGMMLNSKTSKNEDRFYAVFPSSKYKNKMESKDMMDSWHITNMTSVKLRLYQLMDAKDKLDLLFLTATYTSIPTFTLPAFATLDIIWPTDQHLPLSIFSAEDAQNDDLVCNFDLTNATTIELIHEPDDKNEMMVTPQYWLTLRPNVYYSAQALNEEKTIFDYLFNDTINLWEILKVDRPLTVVCIPLYVKNHLDNWPTTSVPKIYLTGSLEQNKWIMIVNNNIIDKFAESPSLIRQFHNNDKQKTSFNIY